MNRKSTTRQQLLLMVTVVTMISALVGVVAVEMPLDEAFTPLPRHLQKLEITMRATKV
jgi:hypothetical protein